MFKRKGLDSKPLENKTANATPIITTIVPPQAPVVERTAARPQADTQTGTVSCIGSGMSIIGNVECNGPAQVFGRVEGEVHASDLLIGDGARVEGSVVAQEVTVHGSVKGTVRAARVRLRKGGAVEGDIFHRSLSIDEDALFEGTSRRVETPVDLAPRGDAAAKKSEPTPTPPRSPTLPPTIDAEHPAKDGDLRPH